MKIKLTFICLTFCLFAGNVFSMNPIQRSDKMKPDWLVKELPKPKNNNYYFLKTEAVKPTLEEARNECLNELTFQITRKAGFASAGETKRHVKSTRGDSGMSEDIDAEYVLTYTFKTDTVNIVFRKVDEYWEAVQGNNSTIIYRCHILYVVAEKPETANFDQVTFSYKYGGDALWRSALVPGYGQIYKGHTIKGVTIMGSEALLIGGIIFCESQRSSYKRKSKETHNIDKVRNYIDNADNYATCRNICIGGAAALYIYNVIDAVVSNGRKRTVVKPNNLYVIPSATRDFSGITLTLNF